MIFSNLFPQFRILTFKRDKTILCKMYNFKINNFKKISKKDKIIKNKKIYVNSPKIT